MEKDLEESKKEVDEKNDKKNSKKGMWILLCIFVVVSIVWIYYSQQWKQYTESEMVQEVKLEEMTEAGYQKFRGDFVKYSKDGITLFTDGGESVWSETFSMKSPRIIQNDVYLVVADIGGNEIFLFDEKGKLEEYTMPYPICDIELAEQGVIAVVLEDQKTNYIQIYDKEGKQIVDFAMTIEQSGYPLDIALSKDAINIVVSAITMEGLETKNTIAFYNFGSVGQNANSNKYVGGFYYTESIFPKVEFIGDKTVCAFGDNKLMLYEVTNKPKEDPIEIPIKTEIHSIFSNNQYIGIVRKNEIETENGNYIVEVYSKKGSLVLQKAFDLEYQKVQLDKDDIIFTGEYECMILRLNGSVKFQSKFEEGIVDLIAIGKKEYLVISKKQMKRIRLK